MSFGTFPSNNDGTAGYDGSGTRRRSSVNTPSSPLARKVSLGFRSPRDDEFEEAEEYFTPQHERREEVVTLARQITRQSITREPTRNTLNRTTTNTNVERKDLFDYEPGSDLDPYSDSFDVQKWTRRLVQCSGDRPRTAGIAYRHLSVHGFGSDADYQKTVGNILYSGLQSLRDLVTGRKRKVQILDNVDGELDAGEMLVVLGPPGSGCTTLLKAIAGEMNGIYLDDDAEINYRGITPKQMHTQFRGEAIYTAEVDVHFPNLVVGDTLEFAARARAPRHPPLGLKHDEFARSLRDVMMSIFGISHTINTKVGNDFIRGVSGGERKRVSIAEAALAGAPLQCWDNSTRGLDAANAIEFVKNLRSGADHFGTTSVVAIYQAPQAAYDIFDKVCVLYEGEQIYFGPTTAAKQFFVDMGFFCPEQQTTPDFLTSLTAPGERQARKGFESKVPTTPKEFAARWRESPTYAALQQSITDFDAKYPTNGEHYEKFLASRRAQQSKHIRPGSPYTLSYIGQIQLCLRRGFQRLKADPSLTFTQLFGNIIMGLIISSIFFNLQPTTDSFYARGSLLFFAVLLNAFGSALEILTLYAQRNIVEKHSQYAFYHPSAEAFASMLTDMPYKITNCIIFNCILYFMTNLRREPGPFFYFLFVSFLLTLTMSMLFRSIASLSRSLTQALAPAAVIILGIVIYAGFALPVPSMHGWSRWINYINPVAYGFESLMVNEFHNREYECATFTPAGPGYPTSGPGVVCSTVGSVAGATTVNGDAYINAAYQYYHSHKWRNVGIIFAFMIGLLAVYLGATELISAARSKGEILIYPRGHIPKELKEGKSGDEESGAVKAGAGKKDGAAHDVADGIIQRQTSIFSWKDVVYDIKIKGEPRRILDHVDGWVKPGTLTALMGVSGAGKTTLLDVLATRVTMGVVTGEMLVDGFPRDVSFQRKTGYVQQQDLHLETSTVREALRFSAVLRQPHATPREEKYAYVEEVLKLLEMDAYADAVVGVPGEGLNVEQRKRLTIGVELVAKPALLLFLDEPTSGLDSQTSWNILQLLRKLTANGQAILCTIHQPSAMLFEQFDRLLFLAKGGRTVYYGEVGQQSSILIDYFERTGAPKCPKGANPAEWMLSAIGAAPGSHSDVDWHEAWKASPERVAVREELARLKREGQQAGDQSKNKANDKAAYAEFAAPFTVQLFEVLRRVFQQYWRTPSYIWAKIALCAVSALFIGFSFFKASNSQQGLQNQLFSVFMMFTIFGQLVQQIMPNFVIQRSLYEVRERPSKTYGWIVFILSNIIVEIPWSLFVGTIFFFCWYYPIGYYRNAVVTDTVHERGALMWLFIEAFMLFTSTFATMIVAGIELAETAGNIANLLFSLCLMFCGVLVSGSALPGFWKFMWRVSPFTYFVEGMLGTAVARTNVVCADIEYVHFQPQGGASCEAYMAPYIGVAGGYLQNPSASSDCAFCPLNETDTFLSAFEIKYAHRWRDFGLVWVYIIVNIVGAIFFYWLARVPKKSKQAQEQQEDVAPAPGDASRQVTKTDDGHKNGGLYEPTNEKQAYNTTATVNKAVDNSDSTIAGSDGSPGSEKPSVLPVGNEYQPPVATSAVDTNYHPAAVELDHDVTRVPSVDAQPVNVPAASPAVGVPGTYPRGTTPNNI
ncbi:Multidrug resistance protein [Vanrija albida]|uniref:Multidrug resistance protein n=1 Tax=Vanrija albida TaxID=181172 RepID=A0ABR3Q7Y8_9TREE